MKKQGRVFLIGVDGATFKVINPLIARGKLPNIKRLMDEGASARLMSTIPPLSPVAWTSISTGTNPSRHGILDFIAYDKDAKSMVFYDSTRRRVKPLWSVLSEMGKRVCAVNVPMTYPVDRVNGFMISGLGTPPTNEKFAHPMDYYKEMLGKTGNYKIDIYMREDDVDFASIRKSLFEVMDFRLKALQYLLDKGGWDFFMFVFTMTDRAQHIFWRFSDKTHPRYDAKLAKKFHDTVEEIYSRVDDGIGKVIERCGKDDTVVIVSDHGFGPLTKKFSMSRWLHDQGLLRLNERVRQDSGGLVRSLKRKVPPSAVHFLVRNVFKKRIHHQAAVAPIEKLLDWNSTKVYSGKCKDSMFLYFNDKLVDGHAAVELKREVREKFLQIKDPATGEKIITAVLDGHEQFGGDSPEIPDLVVVPKSNYEICFELRDLENMALFQDGAQWSGTHEPDGILIMRGPGCRQGVSVGDLTVTDVAPTVYSLLGVPVPGTLDGVVARECLSGEFIEGREDLMDHETDLTEAPDKGGALTEEESEEVMKKLKGLGYL